jgi:hypothetical protein
MILASEDHALAQDYIKVIKQQEQVLWEGRMYPIEIKSAPQIDEILIIVNLILISVGLSILTFSLVFGGILIALSLLLSTYLFLVNKKQKDTQYYKLKHNRYLVTPKKCIFIHWYQQEIHINTLAANSIQKVKTDRNSNGEISVIFHTKHAVDFNMSNYIDNEKMTSVGFINVGQEANKITKIIREQLLRET